MQVLRDAVTAIDEQIAKLQAARESLLRLLDTEVNESSPTIPVVSKPDPVRSTAPQSNGQGSGVLPMGDAAARVLNKAGREMHLDEIMIEVAKMREKPDRDVLRSALSKDYRQRFEKTAPATFKLKEGVEVS